MARGNGDVHHCHSIHAAHVGDYLEHWAVTGIKLQECPICQVSFDALGRLDKDYPIQDLEQVKKVMEKFHTDPHHFAEAYKQAKIKLIPHIFWKDFLYANIYLCIPPDILHQLHQGLIKHIISWIYAAYSKEEIDARCCRLPPNYHIHHFKKDVTHLTQLTGKEYAEIAKILMGLIIDMPLPGKLKFPIRVQYNN